MTPTTLRLDDRETLRLACHDDGTALLTLNRPEKHNALGDASYADLRWAIDELDRDPGVRACVVTGAGASFCAGGDIDDFVTATGSRQERLVVHRAVETYHQFERADTVFVAAVNGGAFGGGLEITLACDVAIASERARFGFREITLGVLPPFGLVRAPDRIGRGWTHWLALTGDVVDAQQAVDIGLIQRVVSHDTLSAEALDLAARIASHPALALEVTKHMINRHARDGLTEAGEAAALLLGTGDHKALSAAFFSRRAKRSTD